MPAFSHLADGNVGNGLKETQLAWQSALWFDAGPVGNVHWHIWRTSFRLRERAWEAARYDKQLVHNYTGQ
jgi:hypothetical protein